MSFAAPDRLFFSCASEVLILELQGLRLDVAVTVMLLQQCTEDLRKRTAPVRCLLHLQWDVEQRACNRPRSSRSLGSLEKSSDTLLLRGLDRPGGYASFGRKHGLGNVNVHGAVIAGGEGVTILHCTTRASCAPGGEGVIVAHVLDAADDTV